MRNVIGKRVEIWQKQGGSAHYKGLTTCGSVWICPVCASKIAERRRVELSRAMAEAEALGLQPYLVTLTIPHYAHESLSLLVGKFSRARRLLLNRKTWKGYAAQIGMVGGVRALEVTHGANGWHVHTHELIFCEPGNKTPDPAAILVMWQKAAITAGFPSPNEHGVTVNFGNKAQEYVTKWGIESEMTKSMIKTGNQSGRTPWDLLRGFQSTGDCADAELFKVYADAFKGRRQLVWSDGLRQLLGMDKETTDEEIVAQVEEGSSLVALVTKDEWRVVLKSNRRAEVLRVAESGGQGAVECYIQTLRGSA